jgi:hypothetical protein
MNIKELKALIANLPDDTPVVECRDGNVGSWTDEPNINAGKVYKFLNKRNYGIHKGEMYEVEYCEVYTGREVVSSYDALIFKTSD